MNEYVNKNPNAEPNPAPQNADPAGNEGAGTGRTFTQEDVNRIVADRLARERAKAEPDSKEQEFQARESALKCRELILTGAYPKEFLEILDTNNYDAFKKAADKLIETFPDLDPKTPKFAPKFSAPCGGTSFHDDKLASAFGLK